MITEEEQILWPSKNRATNGSAKVSRALSMVCVNEREHEVEFIEHSIMRTIK